MTPPADPERYKNHRFPGEIISHGVWLYYRFPLTLLCGRNCQALWSAFLPFLCLYALSPDDAEALYHAYW
jgi:hypothetical protein